MKPFDQVRTGDGRHGVVKSVDGRHVTVLMATGDEEYFDVDDLVGGSQGPADCLGRGELAERVPFSLRLQALYLRHAYRFDLRSGLSNARVEPKLHQVFIAHRVTNKLQPRMILADEVGLGKTIEAGLILKELRARGLVDRVLIVCPASLQYQWQNELRSKFNEDFEIMNSAAAKYLGQGKENPFSRRDNLITSISFAQNEARASQIIETPWDLVIFDEAHRVRRSYQSANKVQVTLAYALADELKELVSGLLLLTATPMQLHPFELYSLVELVEPGLFRDFQDYERRRRDLPRLNALMKSLMEWTTLAPQDLTKQVAAAADLLQSVGVTPEAVMELEQADRAILIDALATRHPLADTMVRNRKSEIGGFAGRKAQSVMVDLTDQELQLFEEIADYLRHEFDMAMANKQNAIGFLMVTYQKMLASSPYAVLESFRKRVVKLTKRLSVHGAKKLKSSDPLDDLLDDLEDTEALEAVADAELSLTDDLLLVEIHRLQELILKIEQLDGDSKAAQLLDALEDIWSTMGDEKVVIFTAFRSTQTYLKRLIERDLTANGQPVKVAVFNGSMSVDQKEDAVRSFRDKHQVLIATEAGGEGRNLQFAHLIVNYDLPWNPMKVEQRIGRLDRIGQKKTVYIYNLACRKTVEERVLTVLTTRIRLFEESVGSLDPILGTIEDQLSRLVMIDKKLFDEEFRALEEDVERRTTKAQENERLLGDFALDRASFRRDEANRVLGHAPLATAGDLESFSQGVLEHHGGTLMPHAEGGQMISLSPRLATRLAAKGSQHRGAFQPDEALVRDDLDFFALGHPLVEKLIDLALSDDRALACVRAIPDLIGGPKVEVIYELQADTKPPRGRLLRHLVGADCVVQSEYLTTMPDPGRDATLEVPGWVQSGLAESQKTFRHEIDAMRSEVLAAHAEQKLEEEARAARIFRYRQTRLTHLIGQQEAWVAEARASGSTRSAKILPAREGKLRKDRDRLSALESEHQADVARITAQKVSVSGKIWSAAVVVPA